MLLKVEAQNWNVHVRPTFKVDVRLTSGGVIISRLFIHMLCSGGLLL